MRMSGKFRGRLENIKTGEIMCWEKHNKVVRSGFDWIADLMSNDRMRANPISHIAFGTGKSVTSNDTTSLEAEVYRAPVTAQWNSDTRELTFKGSIPNNSGLQVSIAEVGLFNAPVKGSMFDRATFSPKGIDDNLKFEYEFVITLTE